MTEEQVTKSDHPADNVDDRASKKQKLDSAEEVGSELKAKIAKQIDYYFSDINLIKDKFMKEQLEKNENCVKLSVLATFSRLAQLTKDEDVIIDALKGYESDYMELEAEKKVIRRKKPLPNREEFQKELDTRTVHISGFPDSVKFDDLHRYCSRYGEVESLSMRQHYKTKQFKGCIHVVFKTQSDAKKVLEGEPLMFKDRELRRESMEQYHARKEEIKSKRRKTKPGEEKATSD